MEALLQRICNQYEGCSLSLLEDDWVEQIWDSQFLEYEDPSTAWNSVDLADLGKCLLELAKLTKEYVLSQNDDDRSIAGVNYWKALNHINIGQKKLISLLFYLIKRESCSNINETELKTAFSSACLYFMLLLLTEPSSQSSIFQPLLFIEALNLLSKTRKNSITSCSQVLSRKQTGSSQTGSDIDNRNFIRRKRGRNSENSSQASLSVDDINQNTSFSHELSDTELKCILSLIGTLVYYLHFCITKFSFTRWRSVWEKIVEEVYQLSSIIHQDSLVTDFKTLDEIPGESVCLNLRAYSCLISLCHEIHGCQRELTGFVIYTLLPDLLVNHGVYSSSSNTERIRQNSIRFILHIIHYFGHNIHVNIQIMTQHFIVRASEKADIRHKAATTLISIINSLPIELFYDVLRRIISRTHVSQSLQRQFTIEVLGRILSDLLVKYEFDVENLESKTENLVGTTEQHLNEAVSMRDWCTFIFGVLISRCNDHLPSVRSKALQMIADLNGSYVFKSMAVVRSNVLNFNFAPILCTNYNVCDLGSTPLPNFSHFMKMIYQRCKDRSVYVRRNALLILENLVHFMLSSKTLNQDALPLLSVFQTHCADPSVMIRRHMGQTLTNFVLSFPDKIDFLGDYWTKGVLPMLYDPETRVEDKAHQCICEVVFTKIVPFVSEDVDEPLLSRLPWKILDHVASTDMQNYFSKSSMKVKLNQTEINVIKSHLGSNSTNAKAWLLLAEILSSSSCKDVTFCMDYFISVVGQSSAALRETDIGTLVNVLHILSVSVSSLNENQRCLLNQTLLQSLGQFSLHPELISLAVDVLNIISEQESTLPETGKHDHLTYMASLEAWAYPIIKTIDTDLKPILLAGHEGNNFFETPRLIRQLITLGELALLCPQKINERLFVMIQRFVIPLNNDGPVVACNDNELPESSPESPIKFSLCFKPSTQLHAMSILTLTKMSWTREGKAAQIVAPLGLLLKRATEPTIKITIMNCLADLCVQYASMVEPYVPRITACLKDPFVFVRKHTLFILIYLLQEEFLKISNCGKCGSLLFRILHCLNDPEIEIRELSSYYIKQILIVKQPNIMSNFFIEALFFFHNYQPKTYLLQYWFEPSTEDRELFSLPNKRNERMNILKYMINLMKDTQRLSITESLFNDIMAAVISDQISIKHPVSPTVINILKDTMTLLTSDEIQIVRNVAQPEGESEPPEESTGNRTKNTLAADFRKKVCKIMIPIILSFKQKLERENSQELLQAFRVFLPKFMKDFQNEIRNVFGHDEIFCAEIDFEIRRAVICNEALQNSSRRRMSIQTNLPSRNDESLFSVPPMDEPSHTSKITQDKAINFDEWPKLVLRKIDNLVKTQNLSISQATCSNYSNIIERNKEPHAVPMDKTTGVVRSTNQIETSCIIDQSHFIDKNTQEYDTNKSRSDCCLRAISTPAKENLCGSSVRANFTFMNITNATDISAISHYLPESTKAKVPMKRFKLVQEVSGNSFSFRFRDKKGRKHDPFDDILQ